jgi:hypothetical protein
MAITIPMGCIAKPRIFKTIAKENQVGNLSVMNYDGQYYWFASILGSSFQYNIKNNKFKRFDFNHGNLIQSVFDVEIVNSEPWFGLTNFGIAVYDYKMNDFRYYTMDDGLTGYIINQQKYSKITSIVYDKYNNVVWAGAVRAGLSYYDLEKKKWFIIDDPIVRNITVNSIVVDKDIVGVGAESGFYYLNRNSNQWYFCGNIKGQIDYNDLIIDNKSIFGVVTFNNEETSRGYGEIVCYDLESKKFETIMKMDNDISDIKKVKDYLVICSNHGLTFYNLLTKKVKSIGQSYGLLSDWANYVYLDGDDIWVLTQKGISKAKIKDVLNELKDID